MNNFTNCTNYLAIKNTRIVNLSGILCLCVHTSMSEINMFKSGKSY